MFSSRVLTLFVVGLAVSHALPADVPRPVTTIEDDFEESPFFTFPLFGNLFAPLWRLFPSFADIGPRIVADENKFQVVVNVKTYAKDDLKVKVKNDFIFVQGSHEGKKEDRDVFASQFFHTYSLPANCSGADVIAELTSDDFLVVTAPIKGPVDRAQAVDREIPITETGLPYEKKEDRTEKPKEEKTERPTEPAPVSEPEDDRQEPTTPADRDITEKDNSIPHGNEIAAL